jgi:flagellar biosynthesis/type III secretory pathway protein FliH
VSREQLRTAITETLRTEGESIMPTIAEQWIQEGIEKGLQEGIEKGELIGRIRTLQEVLGRKVDTPEVLAKLSREDLKEVAAELNAAQRDRN